ncbi:hypothetical protein CHS0354_028677 [Potamilus streckersoni]|uniref:Uncharacterized protein n=1 Tax=Potamilus streckersoni TaxID=2493646 RepID=A0AAE0W2R1_9BIVA|nr:hypothetical protein CHS0354_028677 [Potamilus streckersoni]
MSNLEIQPTCSTDYVWSSATADKNSYTAQQHRGEQQLTDTNLEEMNGFTELHILIGEWSMEKIKKYTLIDFYNNADWELIQNHLTHQETTTNHIPQDFNNAGDAQ